MKKIIQLLFHRVTFIVVFMLIQLGLLVGMVWQFNSYFVFFYGFSLLLSAALVLGIINSNDNPAYKIAWLIPILILPIFGGLFYLVFGHSGLNVGEKKRLAAVMERVREVAAPDGVLDEIRARSQTAANQSRYIADYAYCPPCKNTQTTYLPLGEIAFEAMKQAMRGAERYIFLEYFIIQEGVMWSEVLEILREKTAQGVDVRVIYDDLGCIFTLPYRYDRTLERMGIRCCVFNPFQPVLSSRFNNRSHRKTCCVDGKVAFTGGINMADEYINAYERLGHWKDTVLQVEGDAAWYMTVTFLSIWEYLRGEEEPIRALRPPSSTAFAHCPGFVQPYGDSPLDGEPAAENIYMNLINKAERYVYITTPYLIIGNEMATALRTAAKCGVDVRIITPHIADKWYVHAVTRHNYTQLLESGVRIFEYTPGFIHAKSFVVDDAYGVVGTVNMDFRSLYLHFENGVWLYATDSVAQIRKDFQDTQKVSQEISLEQARAVPFHRRLGRSVLSVFSPLM